jgi:hypothetical protein
MPAAYQRCHGKTIRSGKFEDKRRAQYSGDRKLGRSVRSAAQGCMSRVLQLLDEMDIQIRVCVIALANPVLHRASNLTATAAPQRTGEGGDRSNSDKERWSVKAVLHAFHGWPRTRPPACLG